MSSTAAVASSISVPPHSGSSESSRPHLDHKPSPATAVIFIGLLAAGLLFTAYSLFTDVSGAGGHATSLVPYILLGVALLIALGFEFVNGFHDTANAVATVIYTHSLPPNVAVLWSGLFNFIGVLVSSGAVAFGIISLLPVELILQVSSGAGFAMVFALLIAAILWNLGTWWLGLPASSSHTLIGSIIGVGVANALMHGRSGTSGVDWAQATKVGYSLLLSPLIGFTFAALLLLTLRAVVKNKQLYEEPKGNRPPPWWIRGLLVLTCTGVSFAHGSNDGQKGMGLIMLILVGTVPMAYALNRAMPASQMTQFVAVTRVTQESLAKYLPKGVTVPTGARANAAAATAAIANTTNTAAATETSSVADTASPADVSASGAAHSSVDSRAALSTYIRTKSYQPEVLVALSRLTGDIGMQVQAHGTLAHVPATSMANVRNDMYLASEAIRLLQKSTPVKFDADAQANLTAFKSEIDAATKFIPLWVKVAVAIALGLGTMVGWKRIVVTVGEKIGKSHLTYAQGASAELVAMLTIGAADMFGLPVSTTHVLSSGVAGTMAANKSGLQMSTVRNMAMAWVLTLPAAILLSGSLYWLLSHVFQ